MSSVSQGDGFIEVTGGSKKRNSSTSPNLPNQHKPESPLGITVRPKPYRKNMIPVIIKNWRKLVGKLRQYHPGLNISTIKEVPKGDLLATRTTWRLP